MQFRIQNMTCGGCARSVTKAIQLVDPAATVTADLPNRIVHVTSDQPQAEFERALATAGFPAVSAA
ncbi:heavy-metal-associated domain-containing protein [Altererythrobacter lauratis]|jgi:copper chaperone|uniref:Heavy-metal-associated domain-containing protein n=1 Tax=Alteraurantiacibacter lauratis TaxID=2054627 RepID=A0ABV7EFD2_9SPHN